MDAQDPLAVVEASDAREPLPECREEPDIKVDDECSVSHDAAAEADYDPTVGTYGHDFVAGEAIVQRRDDVQEDARKWVKGMIDKLAPDFKDKETGEIFADMLAAEGSVLNVADACDLLAGESLSKQSLYKRRRTYDLEPINPAKKFISREMSNLLDDLANAGWHDAACKCNSDDWPLCRNL